MDAQITRGRQPGTGYTKGYTELETRNVIGDTAIVLRSDIGDSLRVAADTTALKLLSGGDGSRASLTELSSGKVLGGGDFTYRASGYTADKGCIFAASGGGYWIRNHYLHTGERLVTDFGADDDSTTNDAVAFQTAIDNGGLVIIPPVSEKYLLDTEIDLVSNLTLIGSGGVGVIKNTDSTINVFVGEAVENVIIDNVHIIGYAEDAGGNSGTGAGIRFDSDGENFFGNRCSNIQITNCVIKNMPRHAMVMLGTDNGIMSNNIGSGSIVEHGTALTNSTLCVLSDNIFHDNNDRGIEIHRSRKITLNNNICYGNGQGIALIASDALYDSANTEININGGYYYNNGSGLNLRMNFSCNVTGGIYDGNTNGVYASGDTNLIRQFNMKGVTIRNSTDSGVKFDSNINVTDSVRALTTIKISDCDIINSGEYGVYLKGDGNEKISISNNTIMNGGNHGIYLKDGKYFSITNNILSKNNRPDYTTTGIFVDDSDNGIIMGNIIEYDTVGTRGIRLTDSDSNIVALNAIWGVSDYDISESATSIDNMIMFNQGDGSGVLLATSSIYPAVTSSSMIFNNEVNVDTLDVDFETT
ncbi:MAG: hypothetical protein GY804_06695, partial [Alphaproteobacteria bacterium]|nr:hypothetical protein [Alphaproteobacteria bacterium]